MYIGALASASGSACDGTLAASAARSGWIAGGASGAILNGTGPSRDPTFSLYTLFYTPTKRHIHTHTHQHTGGSRPWRRLHKASRAQLATAADAHNRARQAPPTYTDTRAFAGTHILTLFFFIRATLS